MPKRTAKKASKKAPSPRRKKAKKPKPVDPEVLSSGQEGDEQEASSLNQGKNQKDQAGASQPAVSTPSAPPAPTDALQRYLWEVRKYSLLTREEEKTLTRRFHDTGDMDAAAKLVTSNLRLVVKIAMEHQRYWMRNLLDLIQEGNVGLLQAVKKFDPFRGIKFSYYASFWIKAYILKFIMDNWRLVRLGTTQAQRKLFYNLRREKQKLEAQGISPGPKLLSHRLGVSEQEVVDMAQRLDSWELSLDAPVRPDSEEAHQGFMPDDSPSVEESLADDQLRQLFHEQLMAFKEFLDNKEKDILELRLLAENPLTLSELGQRHGISRERVRQIQVRLMQKLKDYLKDSIPDFESQFADLIEGD
jgi:RNA polymerase sigma-32 factor